MGIFYLNFQYLLPSLGFVKESDIFLCGNEFNIFIKNTITTSRDNLERKSKIDCDFLSTGDSATSFIRKYNFKALALLYFMCMLCTYSKLYN